MARKDKSERWCTPAGKRVCGCEVESVISVDDRGQMVLPKGLREKANIRPGDKLTVVSWEKDGKVSCISLIKAEDFAEMVRDTLGPIMSDTVTK